MVVEAVVGFFVGIQVQSVLDFDGENQSVGIKVVKRERRESEAAIQFFHANATRTMSSNFIFEFFTQDRFNKMN